MVTLNTSPALGSPFNNEFLQLTSEMSVLSDRASQQQQNSLGLARLEHAVVFKESLDKRFECPVCCQVLRYPVRFDCGHRCCSSCLPELLR